MTRSSTWNRDDPKEERCRKSVLLFILLADIHFQTGAGCPRDWERWLLMKSTRARSTLSCATWSPLRMPRTLLDLWQVHEGSHELPSASTLHLTAWVSGGMVLPPRALLVERLSVDLRCFNFSAGIPFQTSDNRLKPKLNPISGNAYTFHWVTTLEGSLLGHKLLIILPVATVTWRVRQGMQMPRSKASKQPWHGQDKDKLLVWFRVHRLLLMLCGASCDVFAQAKASFSREMANCVSAYANDGDCYCRHALTMPITKDSKPPKCQSSWIGPEYCQQ